MTASLSSQTAQRVWPKRAWWLAVVVGCLLAACQASPAIDDGDTVADSSQPPLMEPSGPAPTGAVAAVCGNTALGPAVAPAGAVVVDPTVRNDLEVKTQESSAGTTFWLAPGTHTFVTDEYGQVGPKDGNRYIGAPGAILDGRGINRYAFSGKASDVTISHLTVRGFVPPAQEGVVNHDSGEGWIIEHNTIEENKGAGLMLGFGQQVRHNCLRNNGQYGMNGFGGDLVVEGNEIVGNNTSDLENKIPGGCGCTGGVKFWDIDGAEIRDNWIHDNRGTGLWADTNNNNFLIEGNVIENNDGAAVFYETSYNLVLRNNLIRNNAYLTGREFADRNDNFPVAAIYISESGGEPRVPARTDKIEIYGNILENNWSGITGWENADRFCNSPANTSTGYCTRLVPSVTECSAPSIHSAPLYDDCRWKTQRLDIHHNTFIYEPDVVGCSNGFAGRMALFSNYGTVPEWSPYKGRAIQEAITFDQQNVWHDNAYHGPWRFVGFESGAGVSAGRWQAAPYRQDAGSTFSDDPAVPRC